MQPNVTIQAANSSVALGSNFTLMMVDADVVGTDENNGQTRHWLVNGVTVSGCESSLFAGVMRRLMSVCFFSFFFYH